MLYGQEFHNCCSVNLADSLIDSGIVAYVALLVGIRLTPLFCRHAKHSDIEHISLIGVDDACLQRRHLIRNNIALDGIGVNPVVYPQTLSH